MAAYIDGIHLRVVAKANRDNMQIAFPIGCCQSPKSLALEILDLFWCESTHLFPFLLFKRYHARSASLRPKSLTVQFLSDGWDTERRDHESNGGIPLPAARVPPRQAIPL